MDRIEGDRVAPAQGRQHLGPSDPQVLSLSTNADGTVGATGQVDLLDFRTPAVHEEEVAGRSLPDQQAEGFARLDCSHLGGHRVENAGGLTGRQASRRGRGRVEATKARRVGSADREHHAVRGDRASVDERNDEVRRGFVQKEPRLEVVRPVHDEVGVLEDVLRGGRMNVSRDGVDLHVRVDLTQTFRRGFGFRLVHVRLRIQGLALQVHDFHDVSVDEVHATDPRPHQEIGGDTSEGTETHDHHFGLAEGPLAPCTDFGEHRLAAVALRTCHGRLMKGRLMAFVQSSAGRVTTGTRTTGGVRHGPPRLRPEHPRPGRRGRSNLRSIASRPRSLPSS